MEQSEQKLLLQHVATSVLVAALIALCVWNAFGREPTGSPVALQAGHCGGEREGWSCKLWIWAANLHP